MGAFCVVFNQPLSYYLTHLLDATKQIDIDHFSPKRPVKPFYVRILRGFTRLDTYQFNFIGLAPDQ